MRRLISLLLAVFLSSLASPGSAQTTLPTADTQCPTAAPAQTAAAASPTGTSSLTWAALDPGDDMAANIIRSVFPISRTAPTGIGNAATVIGQIVQQLTTFVIAITMFFVCYTTIMHIFRAAETARILSSSMSYMSVVRMGMGAILMFPLGTGFSAGQAAVVQVSLWGIGMAKTVYANAVQAIGPNAMLIAQPMVPGTKTIVEDLIKVTLCQAIINDAANNPNLVPTPNPVVVPDPLGGPNATLTWSYSLSAGNEAGSPVCGTVSIVEPNQGAQTIAGVSVDMAGQQQTILDNVLQNDILPTVTTVAQNLWTTRQASALTPLQGVLSNATNDYTTQLAQAATNITCQLRANMGNLTGGQQAQTQLSALGWTAAGAYYLQFAKLNGETLSLLTATPSITQPSFSGLGPSLSADIAPLEQAFNDYMTKLDTYVATTDGLSAPGGNSDLFSGATPGDDGSTALDQLARRLHITDGILQLLQAGMSPTSTLWTDPFGGLMILGHRMMVVALSALGLAAIASSTTATAGATVFNVLTLNFTGAAATVVTHLLVTFLATPIFMGCLALLIPGITIAFVLPAIPWVMWMAGVMGWIILVCEAVIAVPLWMLAHITLEGDGLHGRATEGYSLLFNILFRPTLMIFGLFLGYFVFAAMAFLINTTFGVLAGEVLAAGGLITNLIGVVVLLSIYVMAHVTAALTSFRMIAAVPHHLPRYVGFMGSSRVDHDEFARDAAIVGVAGTIGNVNQSLRKSVATGPQPAHALPAPTRLLTGPSQPTPSSGAGTSAGMDTTLRATTETDMTPREAE
jgi:conjugal transfer/type IV secretion protein DotA/TraY